MPFRRNSTQCRSPVKVHAVVAPKNRSVNFIRQHSTGFFVASLLLGAVSAAAVELFWENAYGGVARLGMLMGYGLVVLLLPVRIFIWQAGKRLAEPSKSLAWQALSDEQFRDAGRLARATFTIQHVGVFCVAFVLGWALVTMLVVAMRFL